METSLLISIFAVVVLLGLVGFLIYSFIGLSRVNSVAIYRRKLIKRIHDINISRTEDLRKQLNCSDYVVRIAELSTKNEASWKVLDEVTFDDMMRKFWKKPEDLITPEMNATIDWEWDD